MIVEYCQERPPKNRFFGINKRLLVKDYRIPFIISMLAIFGLGSCIDEINIEVEEKRNILVVEGFITSEYGPHRIRLSKSARYASILEDQVVRESNARVWLRNEIGDQVFLEEGIAGTYWTPENFKAKVGSEYTLSITLANGERYISTKEKIVPVPKLDSIVVAWKKQPSLSDIQFDSGFEIFAQWNDPEEEANFYSWKTSGIYKMNTRPDLFRIMGALAPKGCCRECFIYEPIDDLVIFKDNLTNGNRITQKVAYIDDDGGRFLHKYMVVLEQRSLTKSAYQFLELLNNQLNIKGNIFDPPPATIGTNIINLDNPDEEVIGYFGASDISRDSILIFNDEVIEKQPERKVNDDCRVLNGATVEVPPFWN